MSGDYGWRIDYDKVIAQTMKALKKAPDESAIKAYEKDPSKENEQALLTSLKPVYSHKGYRMDYTNKQNDWDTQNYSEVDLSAQEVFVYKKGKLVFSTTCITGKATPDRNIAVRFRRKCIAHSSKMRRIKPAVRTVTLFGNCLLL